MSDETNQFAGECYCGKVTVTVSGSPVVQGYCHCRSCRKWHAAPVNAWSLWRSRDVVIVGETRTATLGGRSNRISCTACGGGFANSFPSRNALVVYPMTLADSEFNFAPQFHIHYSERVLDFSDGLPKFSVWHQNEDGTSGELISDTGTTGWCVKA